MRDGRALDVGEAPARSPSIRRATASSSDGDDPRSLGVLPRLGGVPGARRRDRRRRAGGALHAQEARRRASPRTRSRYCLRRGGHRRSPTSTTSASTTSRCSSSSACSRRTSASRRSGLRSFLTAMPVWLQGEALHPPPDPAASSTASAARCSSPSTTSRTPRARSIPSPFAEAAILTIDGVGEWATSSYGVGRGQRARAARRAALPALARPALLGVHLLHRLQGELGRVQGDGARARTASRATPT